MAKKSAKSKGYRKANGKKPYLSKRDIAILCVILVAIGIGAFFLFRYDDGALKVVSGAVQAEGDNWLIVDGSNVRGRSRYFKLGEVGDVEGYVRTKQSMLTDSNLPEYLYSPASEVEGPGAISAITVTTSHSDPEALAKYAMEALASIDGTDVGELQTAELAGRTVRYYIYTTEQQGAVTNSAGNLFEDLADASNAPAEAEGEVEETSEAEVGETAGETEETEEIEETGEADDGEQTPSIHPEQTANRFGKYAAGYIQAAHDSSVVIRVDSVAGAADGLLPDETLLASLEQAAAAVTLEEIK